MATVLCVDCCLDLRASDSCKLIGYNSIIAMRDALCTPFYVFSSQMMCLFAVVGLCYVFLLTLSPKVVHRLALQLKCVTLLSTSLSLDGFSYTMVYMLVCISVAHVYRMITDYGGYHLDFTG